MLEGHEGNEKNMEADICAFERDINTINMQHILISVDV